MHWFLKIGYAVALYVCRVKPEGGNWFRDLNYPVFALQTYLFLHILNRIDNYQDEFIISLNQHSQLPKPLALSNLSKIINGIYQIINCKLYPNTKGLKIFPTMPDSLKSHHDSTEKLRG